MSKKDHDVKNQLKDQAHGKPGPGGARPDDQNDMARTPKNPREQGPGHQRQP